MFPKAGKGKEKKETVTTALKEIVTEVKNVSTGGQKETWSAIETALDPMIDVLTTVLNVFGVFKKG